MAQSSNVIDSGGYVVVRESIIRGSGPEGPDGPTGPRGAGLHILGELADKAALDAIPTTGLEEGDSYTLADTGRLWSWFALTASDPMEWHDAGRFKGDTGYLMSVMAQTELAAAQGAHMVVTAGEPIDPTFDITLNDVEAKGEGEAGTKTTVLGLRTDQAGDVTVSDTDAQYIVHGWPVNMSDPNEIKTDPSSMNDGGTYLVTVKAQFTPTASGRGIITLKLIEVDFSNSFVETVVASSTDDTDVQAETVTLVSLVRHVPGRAFRVSLDSTLSGLLTGIEFDTARLGGGYGPIGAIGDKGEPPKFIGPFTNEAELLATTPQEGLLAYVTDTGALWSGQLNTSGDPYWFNAGTIKGDVGNPSGGYASWDAIAGVTGSPGSEGPPGSAGHTLFEPDQNLPYPNHTTEPHTPYSLKTLVDTVAKKLVSRFDTVAGYDSARPVPENGELYYLDDSRTLKLEVGGNEGALQVAPVVVDSGAPPADGSPSTYPEGTTWIQVTP